MKATDHNYWSIIRELMAPFPGTEESTSYGTPAYKVHKKLLLRLQENGGDILVLHSDDRDIFMASDASVFFVTPHYANYPWVLVRLNKIRKEALRMAIIQSWTELATEKLRQEYQNSR